MEVFSPYNKELDQDDLDPDGNWIYLDFVATDGPTVLVVILLGRVQRCCCRTSYGSFQCRGSRTVNGVRSDCTRTIGTA